MNIKTIQEKRQLSYRQLAKECFVPHNILWKLLNHDTYAITFKNFDRLINYQQKWRHIIDEDKTIQ